MKTHFWGGFIEDLILAKKSPRLIAQNALKCPVLLGFRLPTNELIEIILTSKNYNYEWT